MLISYRSLLAAASELTAQASQLTNWSANSKSNACVKWE